MINSAQAVKAMGLPQHKKQNVGKANLYIIRNILRIHFCNQAVNYHGSARTYKTYSGKASHYSD